MLKNKTGSSRTKACDAQGIRQILLPETRIQPSSSIANVGRAWKKK